MLAAPLMPRADRFGFSGYLVSIVRMLFSILAAPICCSVRRRFAEVRAWVEFLLTGIATRHARNDLSPLMPHYHLDSFTETVVRIRPARGCPNGYADDRNCERNPGKRDLHRAASSAVNNRIFPTSSHFDECTANA
jgi:hypothetical protein